MTTTERSTRARQVATAWGPAALVDQVELEQDAGGRRFGVLVQLLEDGEGEQLVRVAYTTDGVARRGPVTLRAAEVAALRKLVARKPALAQAVGLEGGGPGARRRK